MIDNKLLKRKAVIEARANYYDRMNCIIEELMMKVDRCQQIASNGTEVDELGAQTEIELYNKMIQTIELQVLEQMEGDNGEIY